MGEGSGCRAPLKLPPETCLGNMAYQEGSLSHEQRRPTALSVQPADQTTASTPLKAPIPRLVALLLCYCFHYILNRCLLLYCYSYCQNLLDHFNIISLVAFYLCLRKRRLWKIYTEKKDVHLLQSVLESLAEFTTCRSYHSYLCNTHREVRRYVHKHTHTYAHTHARTHARTHAHTHTHTHTHHTYSTWA